MRMLFLTLSMLSYLLWIPVGYGQSAFLSLNGRVLQAETAIPLEAVSVHFLDFDRTIQTDKEGRFTANLPSRESYRISVSLEGYREVQLQVVHREGTIADIDLEPIARTIEEVVVNTGYQKIPRERATGSFEFVDKELFNRQIGTDVISRLDGIMPSILFDKRNGSESDMIVRGVSSLGTESDRSVLIVVDNFPFEGDINNINPNDVESVTLLKDAAAASIWGARAGNGVLVITTKRGAQGSPWRITATANGTFTEKPNLYYLPRMTSSEFIDVEQFLFERGVFNSAINNVTSRPPLTPVVEMLHQHAIGHLTQQELERELDALRRLDIRDDLHDYFYRTGFNQQYALNVAGGGERSSSLFSVGYDKNNAAEVGTSLQRVSLNMQNTFQLAPKLDLQLGMRYGMLHNTANHQSTFQMSSSKSMYPYADLVDIHGNALAVTRDYRAGYLDVVDARGNMLDWRYRPYQELDLADNTTTSNNVLFNTALKYTVLDGVQAEAYYQLENQSSQRENIFNEQTYFTRNMVNRYARDNGSTLTRAIPLGAISDRIDARLQAHSIRGQLSYGKSWAAHHLSAILGGEMRSSRTTSNSARQYGYDTDILTVRPVDYITRHPLYDNLAGAATIPFANSAYGSTQRFISTYLNGAYTYADRYTVSLSGRRDASNLFGVETNNKWTPLWSVGTVWNVANESFYNLSFLPRLKLRGTYGYSGNIRSDVAAVTTIDYYGLSRLGRYPYAVVQNPPNAELRWEKIGTFNMGLDFGIKGDVFSGSVEYYNKKAVDVITSVAADPTTGFDYLQLNSAVLRNKGLDVSLNGSFRFAGFSLQSNLLFSKNLNRVETYLLEPNFVSQYVGNGNAVSPIVGKPAYPLVSYRWAGLDPMTGDPMGYISGEVSKDYPALAQQATLDDLIFHGSALPEYYGAFRNTLQWKGLSVSVNITYRAGYFFRRQTITYANLLTANGRAEHGDFANRWQNPGDELQTTVPSLVYPANSRRDEFYKNTEVTAERGDHIRLQDINVSYILPSISAWQLKEIKITGYARNLGMLWRANDRALDPDVNQLPFQTTYAIGLTTTF